MGQQMSPIDQSTVKLHARGDEPVAKLHVYGDEPVVKL